MKKKILSVNDPKFETCKGRVVIERDDFPPNPMKDYDQVFLVWSNIPNEMSGSPNAEDPYEDVLDEDGCETGERKLKGYNECFEGTLRLIPASETRLIPDLYHIVLHILILLNIIACLAAP